ncbi:ankyrin repeat protein-like protein, partial [Leptotrombidium deliense]
MGNFEEFVSKCICAGIDVNKMSKFKVAPIHIPASNDLISCTEILLAQQNIDVNIQDGEGNTALHRCAQVNNKVISNELIVKGENKNKENKYNLTPFEVAMKANPVAFDCMNVLLSKGIDIRHRCNNGNTALHIAVSEKRLHNFAISFIPANKFCMNYQNDDGDTTAHLAARNGDFSILDALINLHADLSIVNYSDRTILDLSVHDSRIITHLISCNVDLNRQDSNGNTALHLAVNHHGKTKNGVKELLSCYKVNINLRNINGYTPLMNAVYVDDVECVKWLLERKCDVNILNKKGHTAIKSVIAVNKKVMNDQRRQIIELLVNEEKCDLFMSSNDGFNMLAIHRAVKSGNLFAAKILLEKDVKLGTIADKFKNLPIHIASSK